MMSQHHDASTKSEQQNVSSSTGSVTHATSESLTKGEHQTMAIVHKDIWENGIKCLIYGSFFGHATHLVGKHRRVTQKGAVENEKFNKNTVFLSMMLGGAFGSCVCSTVSGKNNVHFLYPIHTTLRDKNKKMKEVMFRR